MVRGLLLLLSLLMLWAVLLVLLAGTMEVTTVALQNFTLGFLLPSRSSEMLTSLVTEWETAFCVAVEVLNSGRETYHLLPHSKLSGCMELVLRQKQWQLVIAMLVYDVVAYYRDCRWTCPRFACMVQIVKLHMSNVTIIYTMGHYALNLANNINNVDGSASWQTVNGTANLQMEMLHSGYNSSVDVSQLDSILSSLQPLDFLILVVNPQEAPDIWSVSFSQKRLEFPWWYFGTDHVTAFGPADEFETDPTLVCTLVAEIGLSPYSGDYSQNYIGEKFHSYWQTTNYSGLPAVSQNKSRTYIPYLINTVTAYFEVCDALWNHSLSITAENILKALNGSGPFETRPWFQGCTGLVAIDSTTGSQSVNDQTTYL
ncbi:unnamed protein product [Sphagnum jensenii]